MAGASFTLSLAGAARKPAGARGARLQYAEVFPGVELRYDLLATGLKETLVLANALPLRAHAAGEYPGGRRAPPRSTRRWTPAG